jgi:hypothetical protein
MAGAGDMGAKDIGGAGAKTGGAGATGGTASGAADPKGAMAEAAFDGGDALVTAADWPGPDPAMSPGVKTWTGEGVSVSARRRFWPVTRARSIVSSRPARGEPGAWAACGAPGKGDGAAAFFEG